QRWRRTGYENLRPLEGSAFRSHGAEGSFHRNHSPASGQKHLSIQTQAVRSDRSRKEGYCRSEGQIHLSLVGIKESVGSVLGPTQRRSSNRASREVSFLREGGNEP